MLPPIQSPQNPQIKQVAKLRDARHRRQMGCFLIDGLREIQRAREGGFAIDCIYFPAEHSENYVKQFASFDPQRLQPLASLAMRKVTYGDRDLDCVAVAKTPSLDLARLRLPTRPLLLVLDAVEKPGNLGACLRTAAATSVDAVILTDPICDVFNPNAIRASRGSVFSLPLALASITEVQNLCAEHQIQMLTARVEGATPLWDVDFKTGSAIILGNEANGLQDRWTESSCAPITIPMRDVTDSLNVSISAAVILYEAVRQRRSA